MRQSSFKLWEGKSPYDGSEIMAVITNLLRPSKNPKTGPMSQLWILPKNEEPWKAIKREGGDDCICGDCIYAPLRAKRARANGHNIPSCYVGRKAFQAPSRVWSSMNGSPIQLYKALEAIEASGLPVRYGAYGDPAMLPGWIVKLVHDSALKATQGKRVHTAYTHQPHRGWAGHLKTLAMASVNNACDGEIYRALGWRTFRVTEKPEAAPGEIICPNFTKGIQCIACGLCDGVRGTNDNRKSITIPKH